mmetsp:Transcript_107159/g.245347  ORF Transcript_107159/g.245347 Transcript_107159/m.245347 type:complete len:154 (+) Transcript_107159:977-1438(+)
MWLAPALAACCAASRGNLPSTLTEGATVSIKSTATKKFCSSGTDEVSCSASVVGKEQVFKVKVDDGKVGFQDFNGNWCTPTNDALKCNATRVGKSEMFNCYGIAHTQTGGLQSSDSRKWCVVLGGVTSIRCGENTMSNVFEFASSPSLASVLL